MKIYKVSSILGNPEADERFCLVRLSVVHNAALFLSCSLQIVVLLPRPPSACGGLSVARRSGWLKTMTANRVALRTFGYEWDEFVQMPSRKSCDEERREERNAYINGVRTADESVSEANYSGVSEERGARAPQTITAYAVLRGSLLLCCRYIDRAHRSKLVTIKGTLQSPHLTRLKTGKGTYSYDVLAQVCEQYDAGCRKDFRGPSVFTATLYGLVKFVTRLMFFHDRDRYVSARVRDATVTTSNLLSCLLQIPGACEEVGREVYVAWRRIVEREG